MKPLYKEKYPLLFTPLIVGKNKVEYKNRIFQAPMGMALGTDANGLINIIGEEYYSSFARGGFAQICLPIEVPKGRRSSPHLFHRRAVPRLHEHA